MTITHDISLATKNINDYRFILTTMIKICEHCMAITHDDSLLKI